MISRAPTAARPAMGVIGPMARTPDDLALALDLLAGRPLDRSSRRAPGEWRFLCCTGHPFAPSPPAITDAIEADRYRVRARRRQPRPPSSVLIPDLSAQFGHYMKLLMTALTPRRADRRQR